MRFQPSRRRLCRALLTGAIVAPTLAGRRANAQVVANPRFGRDPFTLGVASGAPSPDGAVIWTRLAPDPLVPGGDMPVARIAVRWAVAEDPGFARVVASGRAVAEPDWAHSVHVEVRGLQPARPYWYRFGAGGATSTAGRLLTAPVAGSATARLRLAVASCQHFETGWYAAYRQMARDDLDLVVHVGDYIYEGAGGTSGVRRHAGAETVTLDDYRIRHAQYRTDPDLQAAHAAAPWLLTWDDHEVHNDYAADRSESLDAPEWFLARRAAAYRAWYEHMPVRRTQVPAGAWLPLHARYAWGDLATLHTLDCRQYRTPQACPPPGRGGSTTVDAAACAALQDPAASMLGARQEQWLHAGLAASRGRWNVLAQSTVFAAVDLKPGAGEQYWTDGWDGYAAARRRLIDSLQKAQARNPVLVGGDVHAFVVTEVRAAPEGVAAGDPSAPLVASEFCGTSISSPGPSRERGEAVMAENPHVRLADGSQRGYVRLDFTALRAEASLQVVADVRDPRSPVTTASRWIVEDGRPGPQRA